MGAVVSGQAVAFIQVGEMSRALTFYRDALGLSVRSQDEHGAFLALDDALLRLTPLPQYKPHPHPVFGWNVPDIAAAAQALRARGVAFTIYDGLGQDELGVWTSPDGQAKVAWFADPDGNVLSLSQA